MSQLNIHMTPDFERDLKKFMRIRKINTKAEAVRIAIREGLEHSLGYKQTPNFSSWLGLATQISENRNRKFKSDKDLWE